MKLLTLKVPEDMDSRLSVLARRWGTSKSAVVRQLLTAALERSPGVVEDSFLQQARGLCGCVEGPGDLSCNPAHLRGYGR